MKPCTKREQSHVRSVVAFIEGLGAKVRNRLSGRFANLEWFFFGQHLSIKVPLSAPRLDEIVARLLKRIKRMFADAQALARA